MQPVSSSSCSRPSRSISWHSRGSVSLGRPSSTACGARLGPRAADCSLLRGPCSASFTPVRHKTGPVLVAGTRRMAALQPQAASP
eukprot:5279237-Alexandrium_andersonii.AAC.1